VEFKLDLRQGEFFQAEKRHYRKTKIKRFTETENARRVWETRKIQVLIKIKN